MIIMIKLKLIKHYCIFWIHLTDNETLNDKNVFKLNT